MPDTESSSTSTGRAFYEHGELHDLRRRYIESMRHDADAQPEECDELCEALSTFIDWCFEDMPDE